FSVKDTITGLMTTGWRLSITPPVDPGRILLNGKEQFITTLDGSDRTGIEMRYGRVNLIAEGRIDTSGAIPVAGWDRSFHSAKGAIHLPPGWSLFDASGIDNIRQTWLKSWRLFDLFLVLIIALGFTRLVSFSWGAVSLVVLVLIQHEPGAPLWVFLNILAALALLKVVPRGRLYALINHYRLVSLFALVLISLPFMVSQVKHGIYPQLEYQWRAMDSALKGDAGKSAPAVARFKKSSLPNLAEETAEQATRQTLRAGSSYSDRFKTGETTFQVDEVDAGARIQTGAGMPTWRWNRIGFSWNGPVQQGETMTFIFVSPRLNMVLGFFRVILLGLLIAGLWGIRISRSKGVDLSRLKPGGFGPGTMALLVVFSFFLAPAPPAGAETSFPPERLLNELKTKLLQEEQPQCAPHCAVNPRMTLAVEENNLSIAMEVHSLYDTVAVPLPGTAMHWLPSMVLVNGNKPSGLYRDPMTGHLWIPLPKGIHRINLKGKLPRRNSVELPFLLKPNHLAVRARGWKVDGLHANGLVDEQLKLTRTTRKAEEKEGFETDLLPSFVEITRVLHLGLTWQTETRIRRKTPPGAAVAITVPLLRGESVTSDVEVENGRVLVHLGPEQTSTRWVSTLEKKPRLVLEASNTLEFSEVWKLDIGTMWHAEIQGIPPIHHQNEKKQWFPQFRPWPGEKLHIAISRPQGVPGQTYTVEKSVTELTPGNRMINGRLDLSLRSSRGSRHTITLPEHSKLQKLVKNNRPQPFNQEGNRVTLSIVPGHQEITLFWQTPEGMGFRFKAPEIDAGIASVDAHTSIKMPRNRWILFCKGPYVGPAVLFWSTVLVLLLISFALGRLTITPLKGYHWFLLGLGLTQASVLTLVPVACWLIALGMRKKSGGGLSDTAFNALQILLPVLTMAAVVVLFNGIHNGLLGHPDMQIAGNGSSSQSLKWYQDITDSTLPRPVVFSLPMTVYRVLILAWALWIAFALMKWLRWGWECYSSDGLWRKTDMKRFIRFGKKGSGQEKNSRPLER
ncbi:MAG TPA: hypothetical protein VJ936_03615, partial [Desulfobacteraceae bacterium]|nr:hypothetical protein [Desulfobacteraceae bacterium]